MTLTSEPAALVLTRQALPTFDRSKYSSAEGVARGAYILADSEGGKPDVILMATGSEVYLCIEAYEKLKSEGVKARVVSMPSWELFEHQDNAYREQVLPAAVTARVGGGAGLRARLGALCWKQRTHHRNAHVWSLRPAQGFTEEIWLQPRRNRQSGARIPWQVAAGEITIF